jgi:hypothetical protein
MTGVYPVGKHQPRKAMMKEGAWLCLSIVLLWSGLAACGRQPPTNVAATSAATAEATAAPSNTPTRRATQTATPSPPTATPTRLPSATPLPEALPAGWQRAGGREAGVEIGVPDGWVNLREAAGALPDSGRFGSRLLFWADSAATGESLLAGAPLSEGAFVFAFLGQSLQETGRPVTDAAGELGNILAAAALTGTIELRPAAATGSLPAAFVELEGAEPFGLFPGSQSVLVFHLLLLLDVETGRPAIFLMGAPAGRQADYQALFEQMAGTIAVHTVDLLTVVGQLSGGETISGTVEQGATDVWTFNGEAGRYVTVLLAPATDESDLTLTLLNPAGNTVQSIDNGYAGEEEQLVDILLEENGVYTLQVGEFFNEAATYQLTFTLAEESQLAGGGVLEIGQQVTAGLGPDEEHVWTFLATAGQAVTLIVTPQDEQLDIILSLFGPDGRKLADWDEAFSGDPEIMSGPEGFELPITGEYRLVVEGFTGHGGRYTISLSEGGNSLSNFYEAGDLAYGDTRQETLQAEEAHAWFIEGSAGDRILILVRPVDSDLDLELWLLYANRETQQLEELVIEDEFLSGEGESIEYTLPGDGLYVAVVLEFFGEAGEYEISLLAESRSTLERAGDIGYGQTVTGTMAAGTRAAWSFNGRAGDVININLLSADRDSDFVIVLKDPAGNTAATVDDTLSGEAERLFAFALTADGTWQIIIQEFFDDGGQYELTLNE